MKYLLLVIAFIFSACQHTQKPPAPAVKQPLILYIQDADSLKNYWVPFTYSFADLGSLELTGKQVFYRSRLTGSKKELSKYQLEAIRRQAYKFMYACEMISNLMPEDVFDSLTAKDPKGSIDK